jgi:dGTPase
MTAIDWTQRRNPDKPKDHRTAYERDYARVVHSASFRRLQAKTQVVGVGDSDFYRTRLTHSMEVSQIGVSITKKLYRAEKAYSDVRKLLSPPMLMATICLAHDLGHPPFGHGGEVALNRCMLPYGGFEGNGQTLRIVTRLEPYQDHPGMNLTRRAVLGLIKYPAPYRDVVDWSVYGGTPKHAAPETKGQRYQTETPTASMFIAGDFKPPKCYLNDEHDEIVMGWVAHGLADWPEFSRVEPQSKKHGKTPYKSLDTSIMELADDIAYGIHDLEDAIGLKIITEPSFRDWFEKVDAGKTLPRKDGLRVYLDRIHKGDFDSFVMALFRSDTHGRKTEIGRLVGHFLERAEIREQHTSFSEPLFRFQAVFNPDDVAPLTLLKRVVVDLMIKTPQVQQLEFKGQKIVTELFQAFATDPERLLDPRDFRKTIQGGGVTSTPRVICDYIAGMTDDYARRRYQQLFEPRSGSVFDRL